MADKIKKSNRAGGAATASGMNFQAAVTATAIVHLARGTPLGWLDGVIDDVPVAVSAETGGAGDDLQIECRGAAIIEAQIKRGLSVGERLWEPLDALACAINRREITAGVLVVCPASSRSIADDLARDLVKIGSGAIDRLSPAGSRLLARLRSSGHDAVTVCARLRIVRMHCLANDDASLKAAKAELAHLCVRQDDVRAMFDRLYRDAHSLIETRGRRTAVSVLQLMRSSGTEVSSRDGGPVAQTEALSQWVLSTTKTFSIIGHPQALSMDNDWVKVNIQVGDDHLSDLDMAEALDAYHNWQNKRPSSKTRPLIEPDTIGMFYRQCVIVGGPGMGKSLLLRRLARTYAAQSLPVLQISLPALNNRMKHQGSSFEEALFSLGLPGSGVIGQEFARSISNWVILCDGLDECGNDHDLVTAALVRFAASNHECRIIVATRPLGYQRHLLHTWRHYELLPLENTATHRHLETLIRGLVHGDVTREDDAIGFAYRQLDNNETASIAARSPLLLAMIAALAARQTPLGSTKSHLYRRFFELIEARSSRAPKSLSISAPVLERFLQSCAWSILTESLPSIETVIEYAASIFSNELQIPQLQARALASDSLVYWQEVGLLERISHGGAETVTFIHRSFAEFCAARFLYSLRDADRRLELRARIRQAAWTEVLVFCASFGLIDALVDASDLNAIDDLKRMLRIAVDCDLEMSADRLGLLLDHSVKHVTGSRRDNAYAIGLLLEKLSRRFPSRILAPATACLHAQFSWSRLVGWACLVNGDGDSIDLDVLTEALRHLPGSRDLQSWNTVDGFRRIGDDGYDLLTGFAAGGCRIVAARASASERLRILRDVLACDQLQTLGFLKRLEPLLVQHGIDRGEITGQLGGMQSLSATPSDYVSAWNRFFSELFGIIARISDPIVAGSTVRSNGLVYLSAFLQLTSFWDVSASNVWAWTRSYDKEAMRELIRAVLHCTGIDVSLIADDARLFLLTPPVASDTGEITAFASLPTVDIWSIDYTKLAGQKLDVMKLEAALSHRCEWTLQLATNVLMRAASPQERFHIARRILGSSRGLRLWAGASIASSLENPERFELLSERLQEPVWEGCEHLVSALGGEVVAVPGDYSLLMRCLVSDNVSVAEGAAKLCCGLAFNDDNEYLQILERAYRHWQIHEEPYPKHGGVVPYSPRLLLLEALNKRRPLVVERLFNLVNDDRSDIRDKAETWLLEWLATEGASRRDFLARVRDGLLSSRILARALAGSVAFAAVEIDKIVDLLLHDDPKLRFAAMGILHVRYLGQEDIRRLAHDLTGDPSLDIRDKAFAILDSVGLAPPASSQEISGLSLLSG